MQAEIKLEGASGAGDDANTHHRRDEAWGAQRRPLGHEPL